MPILDDGFQDYKIKKDLNIVCFNQNQLIGNGLLLPSGPLREGLSFLKNAHNYYQRNKGQIIWEQIIKHKQEVRDFLFKYIQKI